MKNLLLTLVIALTLNAAVLKAQNNVVLKKNHIENLNMGIKSDNPGLKKSAIYWAGKYEVKETANTLIRELKKDQDASVKILIALALYRIGTEEGLEAVETLAKKDSDKEVRRMANAIVDQWLDDKLIVAFE
jgi:HEAT repeat protein